VNLNLNRNDQPFTLSLIITSCLFAIGFVSILGQVALLRELSVAFYGVELIYTLALGIWLLFSACGTMIGRRISNPSIARIHLLFLLLSISILLDIAFIRSIRRLFSDVPGAYLPLHTQIAAISAALLPVGLLLGLLFQWAAKAYVTDKRSLASAYSIESLGGLAGGIGATFFLKLGYQNLVLALLCALFAAIFSFPYTDERISKPLRVTSLLISVVLIIFLFKAPVLDRLTTSWTHPNLVEMKDTPYSRVTITALDGQVSVFENDALIFDSEGTRTEEFVHLAALQHPNPERILILGGGVEGIVLEALKHSPQAVDYVELNPVLPKLVPHYLSAQIQKSLQSKKVRIIIEDPRQFLNRASGYDLILVGMPEPSSGQTNRFYTREFFEQCHRKLNQQGILAFRLQSSENLWTWQLARRMASIYRAAKSVFQEIQFIPGGTNIVIGSAAPLTKDASILALRLAARNIKAELVSPNYLRYQYTNDRFLEVARTLQSGTAPMNTDMQPICYQYTTMIWLSKFLPALKLQDFSFPKFWSKQNLVWLAAFALPILLLSLARWPVRRTILMGLVAFAGMVLETTFLLHFQTKNGILYQDIGILLTSFMAGLAWGAFIVPRIHRSIPNGLGIALLLGFVLLCAATGYSITSGRNSGLLEISGLLLLTGFFVAGVFAWASLRAEGDPRDAIIPLYSADLIGGCLGSILASLMLAPIAGLASSVYWMAPLIFISVLLIRK
jgi:spermidine synthase